MLHIQILTSEAEVDAIADEWRGLQAAVGRVLFTDYDWLQAWWQTLAKPRGKSFHIVTGRRDGKLVALLPLAIWPKKGMRILQNAGKEGFYPSDVLALTDEDVAALWQAARTSPHYDFAVIGDVESNLPTSKALSAFATHRHTEKYPCLKGEWKDRDMWIASLPQSLRRELRRTTRRLEEKAPVTYHTLTKGPLPKELIDGMVDQKMAWCELHGKHGLFDQPNVREFFHALLQTAAKGNQLFFSWLQCGDTPIAYSISIPYRDMCFGYLVTYDPKWAQYSPGTLLIADAVSWSVDNKVPEFNFMQGDSPYKLRFAHDNTRDYNEWTFHAGTKGWLMETAYVGARGAWRMLQDMKKKRGRAKAKPSKD
jgi:CelD/BcsL family acetyltransferase involved in cellulose biosynthesis